MRFEHAAQDTYPFWTGPVNQRWPVLLDDASTVSLLIIDRSHLLDEVTPSGSQLIAFPPLLLTFDNQSPATGRRCLSSTGQVRVDRYSFSVYHRTNIDTQLSKNKVRSLPPIPRLARTGFGRTDRTKPVQAERPSSVFVVASV